MRPLVLLIIAASSAWPDDALSIMNKVAAHMSAATEVRREFVYRQKVHATMSRADGQLACRETREYTVTPQPSGTDKAVDKALAAFSGEYLEGKHLVPYTQPAGKDRGDRGDRRTVAEVIDELVNARNTRDGIPTSLFPLRADEFPHYIFTLKGETTVQERPVFDIAFEPAPTHGFCLSI